MEQFKTIKHQVCCKETIIEKSRFLAYAKGLCSIDDAVELLKEIKKKNYSATHNCYAYIFDDKVKFSDDGEPQGTAGLPILECIKNKGLNRVCVVVSRYFGGVKLGAGGLVRAYCRSSAEVLNSAEFLNFDPCTRFEIKVPYGLFKTLEKALEGKAKVEKMSFDSSVTLQCLTLQVNYSTICDIVTNSTGGTASIVPIEQVACNYCLENAKT